MKRLLSTENISHDVTALVLRVGFGIGMMTHGYGKIQRFESMSETFVDYFGIGSELTLILVIFAEFFCAGLLVLGALTRYASIPLFITMFVAFFVAHAEDDFGRKEKAFVYMIAFIVIFIVGSGKYSVDRLIKN